MTSNSAFTDQILLERLGRLNNSQQSIETLSHWCIFHRKRAKQVVHLWQKDFLVASNEKKVSFLYLANDILQNSRKKGPEYVNEFWKVIPGVLRNALDNGYFDKGEDKMPGIVDRLIGIWSERKVFGTKDIRDSLLPQSAVAAPLEEAKPEPAVSAVKLPAALENISTELQTVEAAANEDEEALAKFNEVIKEVQKIEKKLLEDSAATGRGQQQQLTGDLQRHRSMLERCIEQLEAAETRRSTLVSSLQELLKGQESQLERIRAQLQIAHAQAEQAASVEDRIPSQGAVQGSTNGKGHVHTSVVRNSVTAPPPPPPPPRQHSPPPPAVPPQAPAPVPSLKRSLSASSDRDIKPLLPRQEAPPPLPPPPPPPPSEQPQTTPSVSMPPGFGISEGVPASRSASFEMSKPSPAATTAAEVAAKLAASSSSVSMLSSVLSTLAAESGSASLASALMNVSSGGSKLGRSDSDTLSADKRRKTMMLEEAVGSAMGGYDHSYISPPPPAPLSRTQPHVMGQSGVGTPLVSGQGMMGMQSGMPLGLGPVPPAWTYISAPPSGPPAYTPYQPPPPQMNYYNPPPPSLQ